VRSARGLALDAFGLDTGLVAGPFDYAQAELFRRELLMPADRFAPLAGSSTSSERIRS
jgi:hypothetical protein